MDVNVSISGATAALLLVVILWPAQLALNNPWQLAILVGPAIFVAVAAGFVVAGATRFRIPKWLVLFTLLWLAVAAVSAFWVGHPRVLQVYGALLLVFYLVAALAAASSDRLQLVRVLVIGVVVAGIAIMVISLAVEPFSLRRYQGFFNNPNSMGWFTAGLMHVVLGSLYGNRLGFSRNARRLLLMSLLLAAVFLLASNSRAALGSVMATVGVLGLLLWSEVVHVRRGLVSRKGVRKLMAALVVALAAALLAWNAGLLNEIVAKFTKTQHLGDLTQGRLDAWVASVRHWTWFGHGPDYAAAIGRVDMVIGHSTWISHLSRYGLANALFFVGFLGYVVWWAWRAARRQSHPAAVVLLAVVVGFAANATFETGTSTPGMWLTVILFAICLQGLGWRSHSGTKDRGGSA